MISSAYVTCREVELFSYLRAYLCRIAVDGLASAHDDVEIANLAHRSTQGIGSGKRVGTGEGTVGKHDAAVCPTIETFAHYFRSTAGSHGKKRNLRAGIHFLQLKGLLESVEVFRVEDCLQARRHG